ncbi:histidine phosphatase family protein [Candidatus Microgenomates bacterium]|nr:histidine phosphatase family protein [Candidatus Microgenomates bacterium]
MNTFYLIRHGNKERERGDPSLTDSGKNQASKTGKYLKDKNIKVIFSSPSQRTKETAQEINKILKIEINFNDALVERANFGDVENQDFPEFLEEWYEASQKRNIEVHGRPSSFQKGEDVKKLILKLSKKYENKSIVLVTHGGSIGDFARNEFGDEKIEKITKKEAYKADESIGECSITKISVENNKFNLINFADTTHLT